MNNDTRFEVRLPSPVRQRLDEFADANGMSASDLVRIAVSRLLDDRKVILKFPQRAEA